MNLSHSNVNQNAMATHDVAPMPPIDSKNHGPHAAMLIASIANSFLRGCRGDAIGRRLAPLAVLVTALMLINLVSVNHVYAQTPDPVVVNETTATGDTTGDAKRLDSPAGSNQNDIDDTSDPDGAQLDLNGTVSADNADIQRVRTFARYFPPQIRKAIDQSRQANRKGPLMVFRHWAQERKPLVGTFLFCLFIGLLGNALFPNRVAVAQECCRSQFWKCIGRAILAGITLIATVRILDLLLIANPLTTLLLAVLELAVVAGLAVGVSLIGEGLTRSNLAKSNYFQSHPRMATFTKICIGSLLLAIIVQIPGAGLLPRIGIRIALLVAILGAGGLLKTQFGTQPEAAE